MCNMPLNAKLDKSNSDDIKKVGVQHLPQYAGSPPSSLKSVRGLTVLIYPLTILSIPYQRYCNTTQ